MVDWPFPGKGLTNAVFKDATFSQYAWFEGVTFSGSVSFYRAKFGENAWFDGATFGGDVSLEGAMFNRTLTAKARSFTFQPAKRCCVEQ